MKLDLENKVDFNEMYDACIKFFRNLFSGHILIQDIVVNNLMLILLVVFFLFVHVGLRYSCENKISAIDKARKELLDVKYDALTRSSQLLEMHKQSRIQDLVEEKDPTLKPSQTPPVVIKK